MHPIITKGGELVNVIPADVRLETYVRGANVEAILSAAAKVDRSLKAGAMALGATVHITTVPGYLPRIVPEALMHSLQGRTPSRWSARRAGGSQRSAPAPPTWAT